MLQSKSITTKMNLVDILRSHRGQFSHILGYALTNDNARQLNLSITNTELLNKDYETYVSKLDHEHYVWLGGYGEQRSIYNSSSLFSDVDRCIHLGVDIQLTPGTSIFAPLAGKIHSFNDNAQPYDYGPTIIIEHELNGHTFHTLYGHLSRESLTNLKIGQLIEKDQLFCHIGNREVNGGWPPHLHFQVIEDMQNNIGDYPGVASKKDAPMFLANCPDPSFLLGFPNEPIIYNI
ncbi:unnamed protein product [Didymodactylos carnosus]|uniref:M23ase beta-sheet core domain-containing protein n=1 Tax=Didymodactylos carnosus TaxID=1234261 RepID=A0A814UNY3_9BILA|nr:unnamed protein product [Didymodactylos carnosus]CAF3944082.1 unnamed protein product [Didymodactylos carnosus]